MRTAKLMVIFGMLFFLCCLGCDKKEEEPAPSNLTPPAHDQTPPKTPSQPQESPEIKARRIFNEGRSAELASDKIKIGIKSHANDYYYITPENLTKKLKLFREALGKYESITTNNLFISTTATSDAFAAIEKMREKEGLLEDLRKIKEANKNWQQQYLRGGTTAKFEKLSGYNDYYYAKLNNPFEFKTVMIISYSFRDSGDLPGTKKDTTFEDPCYPGCGNTRLTARKGNVSENGKSRKEIRNNITVTAVELFKIVPEKK